VTIFDYFSKTATLTRILSLSSSPHTGLYARPQIFVTINKITSSPHTGLP